MANLIRQRKAHLRKLNLSTFPHHKHDGSEDNVVQSNAPFLAEVLKEVEQILVQF